MSGAAAATGPGAAAGPAVRALLAAITFLTIVPIGRRTVLDGTDVARGAVLFPVVGAGIGAVAGGLTWAIGLHAPPPIAAALAVTVASALTGALHLDGLADCADGYGGRTVEDRLRIMRDHTIGTYGAVALILDLLLKVSALAAVSGTSDALLVGIAASAIGRLAGPVLAAVLPYAQRTKGAGAALSDAAAPRRAAVAFAFALAIAVLVAGWHGAVAIAAALVVIAAVRGSARRRLGGVTGDVMGATAELAEVTSLCVLVIML
jgi:adenosylcobinamide-GDP ribazoletransferase